MAYRFKLRAVNSYGTSEFSEEMVAGLADYPIPPSSITKLESESGETYMTIEWQLSADTDLPVVGYRLSMDNGHNSGVYSPVVRLSNNVFKYLVTNLETSLTYGFVLTALNMNGEGI
jgi:hypothetical protein